MGWSREIISGKEKELYRSGVLAITDERPLCNHMED